MSKGRTSTTPSIVVGALPVDESGALLARRRPTSCEAVYVLMSRMFDAAMEALLEIAPTLPPAKRAEVLAEAERLRRGMKRAT